MSNFIEQAVMELKLKLDRSEWSLVRFGDVAIKQNKSVDRENTHLKNYVKGEHMLSEDLHLRDWGDLADEYLGPAFIRYFEEGDILYGSRRTYLRKVTIAPFEGITSNTTFVIKANEAVIDQRLLPFVMLSEGFSQHSIRNSKGSVNPYVNWKDIAGYEFLLPPKAQQAEIAELLWAIDNVVQKDRTISTKLEISYLAKREDLLGGALGAKVKLGDISKLQGGATFKSRDSVDKGVNWLKIANVGFGEIKWQDKSYLPSHFADEYPDFVLNTGDIVLALTRPILGDVLKVSRIRESDSGALLNQRVGRIRLTGPIDPKFLYEHLRSRSFMLALKKELQGTDPPNISTRMYENYQIRLPSLIDQINITTKLELMSATLNLLLDKTSSSISLQKSLVNQVF